jgi:hypothetical protein
VVFWKLSNFGYIRGMTELLNKAFEAASKLPQIEQDALARELLARFKADTRWDELFADPRSEAFLAVLADDVHADIARGDVLDYDPAARPK